MKPPDMMASERRSHFSVSANAICRECADDAVFGIDLAQVYQGATSLKGWGTRGPSWFRSRETAQIALI